MPIHGLRSSTARHIGTLTALALALWPAAVPSISSIHAQSPAKSSALTPELQKVRAALEKYRDPIVAVRDGYFSTLACVEYVASQAAGADHAVGAHHAHGAQVPHVPGGMGVHFFNVSLVGPKLDPLRPQVLIYEPRGDKLELVAAEWFVPLATGVKQRPTLFGQPFDGPMEGHEPAMPAAMHHYDLHVWLWKPNPAGVFTSTNPDLKCPHQGYPLREQAPMLVED
jgi:hypothetical protein